MFFFYPVLTAVLFFSKNQFLLAGTCLKLPNRGVALRKKVVRLYRITRQSITLQYHTTLIP